MHCRSRNIIIPFTLFMLMHVTSHAQQVTVKAGVDRTTIFIGEPIKLNLEATVTNGTPFTWFKVDSIPHFEIVDKGKFDSVTDVGARMYKQQFTITSFDSGYWTVPAFVLQSGKKKFRTDTFRITVTFTQDTSKEYHDIKEIIAVKKPANPVTPWIIAGAVLIALLVAFYVLRRKQILQQLVKAPASKLTPLEEAMQAMETLRKEQLPQKGLAKQYYTRMNDILRLFVTRKFKFSSLEKTNDEIIMQLRQLRLPTDEYTQLAQALRMADFVKFAKYMPSEADQESSFQTIKQSISKMDALATT
jgi:hypothetical protein